MTTTVSETPTVLAPDLTPLCDEAEFAEEMAEMVADEAPRLFAVVREVGERVDGWIAAWGMAFDDHVEVVGDSGRMSLSSPDRARWMFSLRPGHTAHIVWVDRPQPSSEPQE